MTASSMAKIHRVLRRRSGESIEQFKRRCCRSLRSVRPHEARGAFAIGRHHVEDGHLVVTCDWGLMFDKLPSEECVIASFKQEDCRNSHHTFDAAELAAARKRCV